MKNKASQLPPHKPPTFKLLLPKSPIDCASKYKVIIHYMMVYIFCYTLTRPDKQPLIFYQYTAKGILFFYKTRCLIF